MLKSIDFAKNENHIPASTDTSITKDDSSHNTRHQPAGSEKSDDLSRSKKLTDSYAQTTALHESGGANSNEWHVNHGIDQSQQTLEIEHSTQSENGYDEHMQAQLLAEIQDALSFKEELEKAIESLNEFDVETKLELQQEMDRVDEYLQKQINSYDLIVERDSVSQPKSVGDTSSISDPELYLGQAQPEQMDQNEIETQLLQSDDDRVL